jgi:protocatechuate 3,4-dioxygenase beta subunit
MSILQLRRPLGLITTVLCLVGCRALTGIDLRPGTGCDFPNATQGLGSANTPPSPPTHHVVVEGVVLDAAGRPLSNAAVGARFACQSSPSRQVSVIGGTRTQLDGTYRFTAEAIRPHRSDGEADFNVHSGIPGDGVRPLREAAVLVAARFVPLDQVPLVIRAPEIRIPDQ